MTRSRNHSIMIVFFFCRKFYVVYTYNLLVTWWKIIFYLNKRIEKEKSAKSINKFFFNLIEELKNRIKRFFDKVINKKTVNKKSFNFIEY